MSNSNQQRVFFISHRSTDKAHANDLRKQLEEFRVARVWLDIHQLKPGDRLSEIGKAIQEVDVMLVLWSTDATRSEWVHKEIDLAQQHQVRTIFCRLDTRAGDANQGQGEQIYINYHFPEVGLARICLNEIMPLLLTDREALDLLKEHDGQLAHVTSKLLDPKGFYGHGYWSQEIGRVWPKLREAIESAAQQAPALGADCRVFLQVMEKAHEGLAPYLQHGGAPHEQVDLANYIDEQGNFFVPKSEFLPRTALPAKDLDPDLAPLMGAPLRGVAGSGSAPDPADTARAQIRAGLQEHVPLPHLEQAVSLIHGYITTARSSLEALRRLAESEGSPAGHQIVRELEAYLDDPHDLLPEALYGAFGHIDDAFLIHNFAYRMVEAGLVPFGAFPVDWQAIVMADSVVRSVLISKGIVVQLESMVSRCVSLLMEELSGYSPQRSVFNDQSLLLINALKTPFW